MQKIKQSYFSYRLKSCDKCTDKHRVYRLNIKDYLKEMIKVIMRIVSVFKKEGLRIYDEGQYEYQREQIQCPLCEFMIC